MTNKFALACSTMCQGLTVADGDIYDTKELADAELADLRQSRDRSRIEDGEEPEGDDDDFFVIEVSKADAGWVEVESGQVVTFQKG